MIPSNSESDLLKSLLEPLLDDFQYWFERSRTLLEENEIAFMDSEQQADLLARVLSAQQEVVTVQSLFKLTDKQVGVDTSVMASWHRLVHECWQVSHRFRQEQASWGG